MSDRAVVFENLTGSHRLPVRWYRFRGYQIFYLKVELSASNSPWFQALQSSECLRRLELREPLYLCSTRSPEPAYDAVDDIYASSYRNNALVRRAQALYGSEEIDLAFKKGLLWELEKFAYYEILKFQIGWAVPDAKKVVLVPEDARHGDTPSKFGSLLLRCESQFQRAGIKPTIAWWTKPIALKKDMIHRLKTAGVAIKTIIESSVGLAANFWKKRPPSYFPYGIAMVSPLRELANEVRGLDFLADGVAIRGDNTLFVLPGNTGTSRVIKAMQSNYQAKFEAKNLNFSRTSRSPSFRVWAGVLLSEILVLARLMTTKTWLTDVAAHITRDYWSWSGFTSAYQIDHFVTYSDLGVGHVGRNIILNQHGAKTWLYLDSLATGEGYLTAENSGLPYRNTAWGFLKYDRCVSWNQRNVDFLRSHKQSITDYAVVGCIWSEHVRLIKEGLIDSRLQEQLAAAGYTPNLKLIAVFDTTYATEMNGDFIGGAEFVRGIQRLTEENPDVFVVLKEKKPRFLLGSNPWTHDHDIHGIDQALDTLGAHERAWLPGYETNPEELMAQADFVVSFPFTSTTIEAMGANIPAVFFDPLGQFSETVNAQIPNLVAQGYEALSNAAAVALQGEPADSAPNGKRFQDFKVLDPFMDAKGLTRFRQLLLEVEGPVEIDGRVLESDNISKKHL